MTARERAELLALLEARFETHPQRHPGLAWAAVAQRLETTPDALLSLAKMEASGGEPDVIGVDQATGTISFADCCAESPAGRRSLCYDRAAFESRKEARPHSSAMDVAAGMGIALMTEAQYRTLQTLGQFDLKTSSWIATPADVRTLGGALFCDRRYGRVFVYHNGAQSYYAARGFRGVLAV